MNTTTREASAALFLIVIGISLTILLFASGYGELAAIGLVIGIITICAIHTFIKTGKI